MTLYCATAGEGGDVHGELAAGSDERPHLAEKSQDALGVEGVDDPGAEDDVEGLGVPAIPSLSPSLIHMRGGSSGLRSTIRYEELEGSAEQWRDRFATAEPFPHVVIDKLFDPAAIAEAARDFPDPGEMSEKPGRAGVLELSDRSRVPPRLVDVSDELLSPRFTAWLSLVSGLDELMTDVRGNWGVLRQAGDGVEGKIHVPPERHPDKPWYRRLTLILHLSEGLSEANGGCFQLWDRDKTAPRKIIAPLFNRAVVFLNSPTAYHNASRTRLRPGQMRRIMQALYFTERAPA